MGKLSHTERVLMGRMGAYIAHSRHDSREMTAKARATFLASFDQQVDPDRTLDPIERARRAEMARKAHFTKLSLAAAKARRKKAERLASRRRVDSG